MKLPHLAPVKFAKEMLSLEENLAKVHCCFPQNPTLAMIFEAAAQSSAAFSQDEAKIGFVVSCKDIELLHQINDLEVIIQIEKRIAFSNICEFIFKAFNMTEDKLYAKGSITIMLQA